MMNKKIQILGTGCPSCLQTIAVTEKVVKDNNIDASVEKVDDIMEIMNYNVLSTPAVVVDGEVKIKGRVPTKAELEDLLK